MNISITNYANTRAESSISTILHIILASICLAFSAQVSIPLSPIPLSLQTLSVLFIGVTLGPKKGTAAVLLYLCEGISGLPVFASGDFGLATLIGPKGGYIIGFILQAYIAGWAAYNMTNKINFFAMLSVAVIVQMSLGMVWLSTFIGLKQAFFMGILPFIPGELFKCIIIAKLLKI